MNNLLSYIKEWSRGAGYPVFRAIIDGKKLNYFLIPAGLKYSVTNDGVIPILNCDCGTVGCGGAYIKVRQDKNLIIWERVYREYYEYDKDSQKEEDGEDINKPEFTLKLLNNQKLKLPLLFDRKIYIDTIQKLMATKSFERYEKEQYLKDMKNFENRIFFYS